MKNYYKERAVHTVYKQYVPLMIREQASRQTPQSALMEMLDKD